MLAVGLAVGCNGAPKQGWLPTASHDDPAPEPAVTTPPQPEATPLVAGPPQQLTLTPAARDAVSARRLHLDVVLSALHVRVPRAHRAQTRPMWNYLEESVIDAATLLRLQRNGLRVGVGHAQWWEPVQATLDAIDGVQSIALTPVRLPPQYPLALELDAAPRAQTLFFADDSGVLTGETWPASRNVLRVSYVLDLEQPDRVLLAVVPEVRQHLQGWRWVRSELGLTRQPNYSGRAFGAAGFVAGLAPGEFILIAPGEASDVFGLIGNAFLVSAQDDTSYDSYVFLRMDVNHVAQRD